MNTFFVAILGIAVTVGLFFAMLKVYQKWAYPIFLPILTCTVIISCALIFFDIPYDQYMVGGEWIQKLLGPAVVALAIPLYNQRKLINQYKFTILTSVVLAMIAGIISVVSLLALFNASEAFILSSIPKSMTTPVAMEVSDEIKGLPSLTAVLVMIAGFSGAIFGPLLYKLFRIDSAISRGVAMGSASHGVGISKLKEFDEETLSMGSLAMSLSAVVGSFICPIFVILFM